MKRLQNYFKDVVAEMRKVTWPSWDELKGATLAVIIFTAIASVFIAGVDSVLVWVVNNVIGLLGA